MSRTHDEGIPDIFDAIAEARSECEPTMTLRDQFAIATLTGYMANPTDNRCYDAATDGTIENFQRKCAKGDAEYCYLLADAMLAAREVAK